MKKLGKKMSFLTKILLVVGLLISNLSSLTAVFANETTEMVEVTLNDESLKIRYLEQLAEEVEEVNVNVYENYTYLDGTSYLVDPAATETGRTTNYSLNAEDITSLSSAGLSHESILAGTDENVVEPIELFDGLYEVKVEITDAEGTVIDSAIYSKNFEYKSGLNVKLYNEEGTTELELKEGKYLVSEETPSTTIVAQILSGGLKPTDVFMYDGQEYFAYDLLTELSITSKMDLTGKLYGDYTVPVSVELEKVLNAESTEDNKVVYSNSLNILYGTYNLNADVLNIAAVTANLGNSYLFNSPEKDGLVYAILDIENPEAKTMLDLYNIVNKAIDGADTITYKLSNKDSEDVLASYNNESGKEPEIVTADETSEENNETSKASLEEYLSAIELDDTTVLTLSSEGLTITYKVVMAGDLDSDNAITEKDLLELINQVVGASETTLEKSDLYGFDKKVNTLDVMYLNEVIKNKEWGIDIAESEEVELNARLDVEEKDIYSGDEFTVEYVLLLSDYAVNGISGLFEYDKEQFELVSVEETNEWLGNNKDGKFLYLGDESLTPPEIEDETETQEPENPEMQVTVEEKQENNEEQTVTPNEYVVIKATFKALKATNEESNNIITVKDIELFNNDTYLVLNETSVSTEAIVVNASSNNNLASLMVAGQKIELVDGVLDYEITVTNDVTTAEIVYELENIAAQVTSIVSPEELAEGTNTITITIASETGNVKVYTITVIREESVKEETTTQVSYNNYYGDYEEEEEEVIVTPAPEEEEEVVEEEKDGNLSRIIIIILILLVIAGLIYLIFKDEDDDETKKANKEINKLKKETKEPVVEKVVEKSNNKPNTNKNNASKNKGSKNNKKER